MAFEDERLEDHPWTWGAAAMIAAGCAHLGSVVLQVLLVGGLGAALAINDPSTDPLGMVLLALWFLTPILGTLVVVGLLFMGARTLRFEGPGPLVWLALSGGVFWPMLRMGLALLACGVFEVPLHLIGALATLAATLVVAVDPGTRQLLTSPKRRR
ncbi:MAG: hypothetical protein R3F61_17070 [Myxococcota bacterium]